MISLLTFLISITAGAEYRAFELVISNSATGQERVEISTLDPLQYRVYYPVGLDDKVTYRSTWRCRGNTSNKPICPRPEKAALDPKSKP